MTDFSKQVSLSTSTIYRQVDDEAVVLNLEANQYYCLNAVGLRMIQTLTESPSIEQAFATLLEEYEISPGELSADLNEFIEKLLSQGLVRVA